MSAKVGDLNERQRQLLKGIRDATDGTMALQLSGDATARGLVARGATVRALERRGLVRLAGYCMEVDGDGFAVTGNDDAPYYAITAAGRKQLAGRETGAQPPVPVTRTRSVTGRP